MAPSWPVVLAILSGILPVWFGWTRVKYPKPSAPPWVVNLSLLLLVFLTEGALAGWAVVAGLDLRIAPFLTFVGIVAVFQLWESRAPLSSGVRPPKVEVSATEPPIKWASHFGLTYTSHAGAIRMLALTVNGTNKSNREITLEDAYFISGKSGERLQLIVQISTDEAVRLDEINAVAPGAIISLKAVLNGSEGFTADEMLARWGPILFYSQYDEQLHQRTFTEAQVGAIFDGFLPKQTGARVTRRASPSAQRVAGT